MTKLQTRLLPILEEKANDPNSLKDFLHELAADPSGCLKGAGLDIPHDRRVAFSKDPSQRIERIEELLRNDESASSDSLRKALEALVGTLDWIPAVSTTKFSMPPGAKQLNEEQLKRIIG